MSRRKVTSLRIDPEVWFLAKQNARRRKLTLCDYLEMLIKKDAVAIQLEEKLLKESGGLSPEAPVLPVSIMHEVKRLRRQTPDEQGFEPSKLLCPNCGSSDIEHKPKRTPFRYNGSYYECIRCKHYFSRWR